MITTYTKNTEKRLLEFIVRMRDDETPYYVVHFRFSRLQEHYKNEYQLKISANVVGDILKEADGSVFITSDFDIFVFCKDVAANVVKKVIFQLRYLYMDDPLAYTADGGENEQFCKIYELKVNWHDLYELAKSKIEESEHVEVKELPVRKEEDGVLTPSKLADVETELGKIGMSNSYRAQPICIAKQDGFKVMFNEAFINIRSLSSQLKTRVDLVSNRWLFKYLTQILDRKMLEYIAKNARKCLKAPLSLNLNTETLLSEAFAEFDKNIPENFKKNIVVEINIADVFTDMEGFVAARKILQAAGYRICLDGLTNLSFLQIDRTSLGFDLAKIFWNADLRSDVRNKQNKELGEAIEKCGAGRIILARCDSQDAIYYGQSLGISLFQGRHIDMLVDPESGVIN